MGVFATRSPFRPNGLGLSLSLIHICGSGKSTLVEEYRITNRGGLGIRNYMVTEKTGPIVGIKAVSYTHLTCRQWR